MTSSRLARRQSQQMLRQTILFIGGAIILGLAFLFVVLPLFVRLMTGSSSVNILQSDTVPPQLPVIVPPPEATPSASVALSGYGESNSIVVLVLNGSQAGETQVNEEGQFTLDVPLNEGDNTLAVFAKDEAGNESATTNQIFITRDNQAPSLEITDPKNGQQIELRRNQVTTVKGKTDPNTTITLNGRRIFTQADGTFTTTHQLNEGENKLQFVATDPAGNSISQEVVVTFRL